MKNKYDPSKFGTSPEEIKEIHNYLEELNSGPNFAIGKKVVSQENIDYTDIDKELEGVDESLKELNKMSAPIAEDSVGFTFKMPPIDKITEKYKFVAGVKTKYNKDKNLKEIVQFNPGDRVNLKQHLRNIYNIPPIIFEFGAYIIDILNDYLPSGQIRKIYRLEEFTPDYYPKPKNIQYLEFEIVDGYDLINNYLELWVDKKIDKKPDTSSGVIYGHNYNNNLISSDSNSYNYYYSDEPALAKQYTDEEYAEMAIIVEKQYKKQYWSRPPAQQKVKIKTGHPLTSIFK